ncbi:hypothetical protein Slala05_44560 [Streptomyces lavendulae subsp. lavendulae]|nr:hypothetical protein Slala05_44560 [Streptomyces lavendulae subsp. lavendulae]
MRGAGACGGAAAGVGSEGEGSRSSLVSSVGGGARSNPGMNCHAPHKRCVENREWRGRSQGSGTDDLMARRISRPGATGSQAGAAAPVMFFAVLQWGRWPPGPA